jgi:hypothetical protein
VTLLTAVNSAQRLLSLAVTSTVIADGQETQNLLYQLANEEAADILDRDEYDWPLLRRTQSFTASLASLQSAPGKPTNFQRAIPETFWNASQDRKIYGPLRDEEWAIANGNAVSSATWQSAMFRYDGLHIFPVPTVADTITYDYIINTPVLAVDGTTYKTAFSVDTDSYLLGDRLLRLGIVWRYKASKGRDYAEDLKNYELALRATYSAQQGAPRVLSVAPEEAEWPPEGVVPDQGYGA